MWRKILRWSAIVVALAVALWWLLTPGKRPLPIDEETTFVTGPLDAVGYVDYAAALNERNGKGVTAENNAAVVLWEAIGSLADGSLPPPGYFEALGIKPPPEEGQHFTGLGGNIAIDLPTLEEAYHRCQKRPWRGADERLLAGWLEVNKGPLDLAVLASRRPRYFQPVVLDESGEKPACMFAEPLRAIQPISNLVRALLGRAMLRAGEGDLDGTWADLMACHRLARLLTHGNLFIEGLAGLGMERVTGEACLGFLAHARPDAARIEACLKDLRSLPPPADMADKFEHAERFVFLDFAQRAHRHGPAYIVSLAGGRPGGGMLSGASGDIDLRATMRGANVWYARIAEGMRLPTWKERHEALWTMTRELRMMRSSTDEFGSHVARWVGGPVYRGKEVGKIYLGLLSPEPHSAQKSLERVVQRRANFLVAFALERYRAAHGGYPATLGLLGPEAGGDMFTAGPLIYRREGEGYLLGSVGPDAESRSELGEEPQPDKDLTVRMPPKE